MREKGHKRVRRGDETRRGRGRDGRRNGEKIRIRGEEGGDVFGGK